MPMPMPTTLGDLLLAAARRDPEGTALIAVDGTARWSWGDLARDASALARRLRVENRPGTVVAVWAASEPAWVVLELACALAGLVLQPIDPDASDAVVTQALERSGARWLAVGADGPDLPARAATLAGGRTVCPLGALVGERGGGYECGPLPAVAPSDPLLILPTSGTTGAPKAVVLSHAAVAADATLVAARMGLHAGDRWLTAMPLHRSGGCSTTVAACVAVGAT